jgi:hypothetical protein
MWERINSGEIAEAKARLSRKREEILSRQAAEIKSLDAQLYDIESFERVVAAFFEEYLNPAVPSAPVASESEQATTISLPEQSALSPSPSQKTPSIALQIRQNILPKFSHLRPARRLIGPSPISISLPQNSRFE